MEYIKSKAATIKELQSGESGDKEIHQIRQQLKAMSTIATLVYSIKPGKHLDLIVTAFNKTEMMIGDWHDRVVLKEAIERFLALKNAIPSEEMSSLILLKQGLNDSKLNLVNHFMPEVNTIVESVLAE
jgi:CHAD domain-containing protein